MKIDHTRVHTKSDIKAQLEALGVPKDKIILMHSSLRLVGKLEEGAKTLLDALVEHCTAGGGLLCVATHTWSNLKKEITLDMTDTKTCLGAFSDFVLTDPRGVRSENPTHSVCVFGDPARARKLIENDRFVTSGTAPDSVYGKLCDEGGYVLLVGVAHNKNTYIHCIDEMLGLPDRTSDEPYRVTVRRASGEIVERQLRLPHCSFTGDISLRFPKYETAFRYMGAITDGFIGCAPTQLCDARIMKETLARIYKNAAGADPLANESAILQKLYVSR